MVISLAVLAARYSQVTTTNNVLESTTPSNSSEYCVDGVPHKVMPSIRAVVGITCILSMVGAFLIILSYILIKDIRTKAREILVNLSVMDFMAATANFIGVLVNFDTYLNNPIQNSTSTYTYQVMNDLCRSQAFFAMYGTISSVLWTICIAVYVFLRIMLEGKSIAKRAVYVFYCICYGLPLIVTMWFMFTGKLGYAPFGGSGWCSVILYNSTTRERYSLRVIFANDLWVYLTIVLVPLIFVTLKFYLRYEMKTEIAGMTRNMASTVQKVELKILCIPIFFILLRVWSLVLTIIEIEAGVHLNCAALLFFLHIGGIGDSGQGFANAILFVLFTPKVRRHFCRLLLCHSLCHKIEQLSPINNSSKRKVFYGAVQTSSGDLRNGFSDDSVEASRDSDLNPHSVLLNNNT